MGIAELDEDVAVFNRLFSDRLTGQLDVELIWTLDLPWRENDLIGSSEIMFARGCLMIFSVNHDTGARRCRPRQRERVSKKACFRAGNRPSDVRRSVIFIPNPRHCGCNQVQNGSEKDIIRDRQTERANLAGIKERHNDVSADAWAIVIAQSTALMISGSSEKIRKFR